MMQASSWRLEEAIQLFYVGNDGGATASSVYSPPVENDLPPHDSNLRYVFHMIFFKNIYC